MCDCSWISFARAVPLKTRGIKQGGSGRQDQKFSGVRLSQAPSGEPGCKRKGTYLTMTGMQQSLEAMQLALRVLTAVTEKRHPDPEDVAKLRQLAPHAAAKTPDELACEVIQNALRHRAGIRDKAGTA